MQLTEIQSILTKDTFQQLWYNGVVLIRILDHYFSVSVNPKNVGAFEVIPNPCDNAPLMFKELILNRWSVLSY